jgi:hypothetical protein
MALARAPAALLAPSPAASPASRRRRLRAARPAPASASLPHDAAARLLPAVTPELRRGGTTRNAAVASPSSSKLFVEEFSSEDEAPSCLCVLGLGQAMVRAARASWGGYVAHAVGPPDFCGLQPPNPKSALRHACVLEDAAPLCCETRRRATTG